MDAVFLEWLLSGPLLVSVTEGGNVISYFSQSNFAGQVIIYVLIIASLVAWSVMIGKYLDLNRQRTLNHSFERRLGQVPYLLSGRVGNIGAGPYAVIAAGAVEAYHTFTRRQGNGENAAKLAMNHVENALQREVAIRCMNYESRMVVLGSIVSGAPFLGLLGTVWGVMDAFGSLALEGGATLQNLAPGVSGALLTTVAALLVAIPSVFGYNYLLSLVRTMILELENFTSRLADRIELELQETEDI